MLDLFLVGSLTRDRVLLRGRRWSQPGGAPWHAGLALGLWEEGQTPSPSMRLTAIAQAGPWVRRFALPGLAASGVAWHGPATASDTVFVNRYEGDERQQRLLSRARSLAETDLPPRRPDGVIVSPLFPDDVALDGIGRLGERGAFVGVDAQGLLRRVDARGRVRTSAARLAESPAGAQAIKFSLAEFQAVAGRADWQQAAREFARAMRSEVLVTCGSDGALLATPESSAETSGLSVRGRADTTGAGDVFLAGYVRARCAGTAPAAAVAEASATAQALLQRRLTAAADADAIVAELRQLHGVGLRMIRLAARRTGARSGASAPFATDAPLRRAVEAHLARPDRDVRAGPAERVGSLLSGCWALFSVGWPDDPRLRPEALAAAVAGERAILARERTG